MSLLRLSLAVLFVLLLSFSCQQSTGAASVPEKVVAQDLTLTSSDGPTSWGFSPSTDLDSKRKVTFTFSATTGQKVAFLFTNTSSNTSVRPTLVGLDVSASSRGLIPPPPKAERQPAPALTALNRLEAPNRLPANFRADLAPQGRSLVSAGMGPPAIPTVGSAFTFKDHDINPPYALIPTATHLRLQVALTSGRRLNLWVADNAYDSNGDGTRDDPSPPSGGPLHFVSDVMLTNLAGKFLQSGTNNDIYDWVTEVLGKEWYDSGDTASIPAGLINGGDDIHVFITNLNPHGTTNGTLMGYFDSTNNIIHTAAPWAADSNEKILFALDADSVNTRFDELVSTLAHEFQHMIHFYQKQVLNTLNAGTDTWINEMASQMVEDLVADKLQVAGPRGVAYNDYSSGASGNQNGRLPLFNYNHDWISLTGWGDGRNNNVLDSYSNAYAFGAWLLRNYGGPTLLHDLVTNPYTNEQAVVHAVNTHVSTLGNPQTYVSLVRDWGLATFLGSSSVRPGLIFSTSPATTGFPWTYGLTPISYKVGSIDLAKYRVPYFDANSVLQNLDGPWIYSQPYDYPIYAGASSFVDGGTIPATGTYSHSFNLAPNVALTLVLK